MIDLARIGGPAACLGLAVVLAARGRRDRLAGLGFALRGTAVPAAAVARDRPAEVAAVIGGALVLGPALAVALRREPWLVPLGALAFVPVRIGLLGHQLLVPLYAVVLGATAQLVWEVARGDERSRELRRASLPLAVLVGWTGLSLAWSVDVHEGAVAAELGFAGYPSVAESVMVERDLALAAYEGQPVHLLHLSSVEAIAALRRARAAGIPASAAGTNLREHLLAEKGARIVLGGQLDALDLHPFSVDGKGGGVGEIEQNAMGLGVAGHELDFVAAGRRAGGNLPQRSVSGRAFTRAQRKILDHFVVSQHGFALARITERSCDVHGR